MFSISNNIIVITRGDTGKFTIRVYDANKSEYELEYGDELIFTVKADTKTTEHLIQKSGPEIILDPADTQPLTYKDYIYDVQLTLSNGEVHTVIPPNKFKVTEEVTFDY
jgi:outer membrane lipoprotein-sorting protein